MDFQGKTVVVTGASQGIGEQVARGFASDGANVVVADINGDGAAGTAESIRQQGAGSISVQLDVTRPKETEDLVRATVDRFGRLDVLVNCAGIRVRRPMLEVTEEDWDRTMDVNAKGTFFCGQAAARWMKENGVKGRIVNIASILSFVAIENLIPYEASKGAVGLVTKGMALELAPHGITVNAVAPGPVRTAMTADRFEDPQQKAWLQNNIPLGRVAEPREIFTAIRYLASEDAGFVTGAILLADGGWTIQ